MSIHPSLSNSNSAADGAMPAQGLQTRRAALCALASGAMLAIPAAAALAAPSTIAAGYRGPGVYTGQGVAAIVGAPVDKVNGVDIGPAFSGQFVPVILTEGNGRVSRFLRAIETSAEFGLTLAVGLDAEAVRSLADGWFGRAAADPIFTAIERHKVAEAAFGEGLKSTDEVRASEQGREVTQADRDACEVADQASEDVLAELLASVPVSAAGARAALEYLIDFDDGYHLAAFAPTLLKSPLLMEGKNV